MTASQRFKAAEGPGDDGVLESQDSLQILAALNSEFAIDKVRLILYTLMRAKSSRLTQRSFTD